MKISPLGGIQVCRLSSVNSGPPYISESTRVRKLKLKMQLDIVK